MKTTDYLKYIKLLDLIEKATQDYINLQKVNAENDIKIYEPKRLYFNIKTNGFSFFHTLIDDKLRLIYNTIEDNYHEDLRQLNVDLDFVRMCFKGEVTFKELKALEGLICKIEQKN